MTGHKFRLPAEWEEREATWLIWPHNPTDWPGRTGAARLAFAEMVRRLVPSEEVRIIVQNQSVEKNARAILADHHIPFENISFYRLPTDRSWTRDSGPLFVFAVGKKGKIGVAGFDFNGWGRYRRHADDNRLKSAIARKLKVAIYPVTHDGAPVVLEGGAIDVNGKGTLITTEECLLDEKRQVRNPGLDRKGYEELFERYLGARNVIWLGKGIEGDDTHGHVDDLCRFVDPRTLVITVERERRSDPNYPILMENRERLDDARLENGARPVIVELPTPAPLFYRGERLPASYANFYIAGKVVLVPTFNDPADRIALDVLSELFKGRTVIGIHAVDLVTGKGTIHCLTMQQPAGA